MYLNISKQRIIFNAFCKLQDTENCAIRVHRRIQLILSILNQSGCAEIRINFKGMAFVYLILSKDITCIRRRKLIKMQFLLRMWLTS